MRKNLLNLLRLVPIALLLCAGVASAQSTGVITGVVTDASTGKPVVGAVVVATSPAVQGEKTAVTDADGAFTISGLPAGSYKLAAQLGSYKPAERSDLVVKADTTLRANLSVVPEAVQMEEVVVTGSRVRRLDLTSVGPRAGGQSRAARRQRQGQRRRLPPDPSAAGRTASTTRSNNGGDGTFASTSAASGPDRTLVLLNGRRMVAGGTGADAIGRPELDPVRGHRPGRGARGRRLGHLRLRRHRRRRQPHHPQGLRRYRRHRPVRHLRAAATGSPGTSTSTRALPATRAASSSTWATSGRRRSCPARRDWSKTRSDYNYTARQARTYPLGSGTIPERSLPAPGGCHQPVRDRPPQRIPRQDHLLWQPAGTAGTVCTTVSGQQSCWRPYVASGRSERHLQLPAP